MPVIGKNLRWAKICKLLTHGVEQLLEQGLNLHPVQRVASTAATFDLLTRSRQQTGPLANVIAHASTIFEDGLFFVHGLIVKNMTSGVDAQRLKLTFQQKRTCQLKSLVKTVSVRTLQLHIFARCCHHVLGYGR
jgi:hypothetical protein